ncbi:L-fucose:H+ symporter permease [Rudanella paleaurantiibacter]|uniref:L-fucose:H+ symporter permease n=1 Tax=Rudanella paleaurantiibacter TaxID=2614655 RepID=A0A7J5TUE5_9BACT|nr:L-fucose:H+ symporter permease [Rudanella paleaurantiibacter]KAB7727279.1 L-fucose:H+ symporter permease [Rudanella paleaurantiibacter]
MQTQSRFPFILITALFFLWGFAHNLNPILIPHLKKACELTDLQSALIDAAFFIGYFVTALPAGAFMKRFGYKRGIITGLLVFAAGAYLFYPAAETRQYEQFLFALFVIASGLTFLETAANPYATMLGEPATATQRLNLAQSFNGLAATLAPLAGGLFILSGRSISEADKTRLSPDAFDQLLAAEAATVQVPYLIIGTVVLLVAGIVAFTQLPEIKEETDQPGTSQSKRSIWQERNLLLGVLTQFFYVGAQVCITSFFIRFVGQAADIDEKAGAYYLSVALLGFMLGRFVGTFLMRYIAPHRLLALYAVINVGLLVLAVFVGGIASVYALIGVGFFMSIMFPTIFALSIAGLGEQTKLGSSLLIMAIAGGALFPLIMGQVSDLTNIRLAYLVPAACFLVVLYFGLTTSAKHTVGAGEALQPVAH